MALSDLGTSPAIRFALSASRDGRDERDMPSPGNDMDENGLVVLASSSMIPICHPQRSAVGPYDCPGSRARALCVLAPYGLYTMSLIGAKATVRVSRALILPCPYHMHELTAGIKTR